VSDSGIGTVLQSPISPTRGADYLVVCHDPEPPNSANQEEIHPNEVTPNAT